MKSTTVEPAAGSVVIDCDGDAWQSNPHGSGQWNIATAQPMAFNWEQLTNMYGPLTLIWSPNSDSR